jgi:hypothetical protein
MNQENDKKKEEQNPKRKQIEILLWKIRKFDMKIKEERENKKTKEKAVDVKSEARWQHAQSWRGYRGDSNIILEASVWLSSDNAPTARSARATPTRWLLHCIHHLLFFLIIFIFVQIAKLLLRQLDNNKKKNQAEKTKKLLYAN